MPEVTVKLSEDIAKKILSRYPGYSIEEALNVLIQEAIGQGLAKETKEAKMIEEEISNLNSVVNSLRRIVVSAGDTLNSYSQVLNEIRTRVSDLISIVQSLSDQISGLQPLIKMIKEHAEVGASPRYEAREIPHERAKERRASAIEILKKQKVMFEEDLASKIRNRDAFFERLRKDGALVITSQNQRIAIDPEYWHEFLKNLERLNTNSEAKLKEELGSVGHELLKELSKSALAYFDATKKKWIVLIG